MIRRNKKELSKRELQALMRIDFATFVERSFYELNPHTKYLHNWHIEVMAAALEECRLGQRHRLIVNLPPRSLKSFIVSVAWVAFVLGHNPAAQVMCVSYGQELANRHALDCRRLMLSPFYQELFPGTRLDPGKMAVHDFSTTAGGGRLAVSIGGAVTGRGADFIVIDDWLKPDEALSETQRTSANSYYDHTLISRLNDKRNGGIIIVGQRLHEDDLVGHVLQQDEWKVLRFPAIAEEDETHVIETPTGRKSFSRRAGEVLHPEREPLEALELIRRILGEYHFAAQYQQSPSPLGGGMIKHDWFKTYAAYEKPKDFELIFQSWDTANKSTELCDYSVCTTWGVSNGHLYLLDVTRKRLDYPELRREAKQLAAQYGVKIILIEDRGSGTCLIQDLIADRVYGVTRYDPKLEKIMRMHAVSSIIENGFVHIPAQADWLAEYLHEMGLFHKGQHDDQVDSTSQALDWFKTGAWQGGWPVEFYREEKAQEEGSTPEAPGKFRKLPWWKPAFG